MAARFLDEHVTARHRCPATQDCTPACPADCGTAPAGAIGYLVAVVPLTFVDAYVVIVTWGWGLIALTYPIQYAFGVDLSTLRDSNGVVHQGFVINGVVFDTWPQQFLVSLAGTGLLLIAPWAGLGVAPEDMTNDQVRAFRGQTSAE